MNGKATCNEKTINFSDSVVQRGAMTSDIKAAVEAQLDAVVRNWGFIGTFDKRLNHSHD